ncbi:unnamed protein product [Clonostachys rosea f. rosea IK726]|uniref:Uncharacterized protein n=1 Tax=Clonostachys rosea f. rosea IK726 TaxID=1349383 RepID=A0ACA9U4A9_BIOOC|nr:unnamed protein product [Clonostachys rosea f. rosea IK726]
MKTATSIIALLATAGVAYIYPSTGTTSLREEAAKKNLLFGSGAINPTYLEDPEFAAVLADQELQLGNIDTLVQFAEANNMVVKGHGLISSCCNPNYLLNITRPEQFRAAMKAHFNAIMHRYEGKVDRWDVVTEALETQGGGLQVNDFYKVLGPGYIEDAFRIAREAAPYAKLLINENLVESIPSKRQGLYNLVSGLVAKGVPIDGIALQMHITEVAPIPGVITDMVNSYEALGLEVTIAEMDVHTLNATLQADIYGAVIKEALDAGITDISFWGFTDKHAYTWVEGAKPLMFDENYNAKGAFYTTHDALQNFVHQAINDTAVHYGCRNTRSVAAPAQ